MSNLSTKYSKLEANPAAAYKRRTTLLSLALMVGLAGGSWVMEAIAPPIAQAYPSRMAVSLNREPGETYPTLLNRAEAAAAALTQRSFNNNSQVTEVLVTVVGESEGLAAPLLTLEVSREQWRSFPNPQRWATYFQTARGLLGLDAPSAITGVISPGLTPIAPVQTAPAPAATAVPTQPPPTSVQSRPVGNPASNPDFDPDFDPEANPETPPNPVQITLPAAPTGQLGLPRSIVP